MTTRGLFVLSFAFGFVAFGCARGGARGGMMSMPPAHDAGILPLHDGAPHDGSHAQPDAFVVSWVDAARHDDAASPHVDAARGSVDAAASDTSTSAADAAAGDAPWPMLDVGVTDAQTVTAATRCWEGAPVLASGVFVGTTCGAIDLVGASCGRPGAPERYFTAFGPLSGGHTTYFVQVDPPEFVIQELLPTEVGFDCPIIDGACSGGHRVLMTSDITQFSIERGSGGCGEFTMTVGAM